jgi:predicted nuclease with TOPRIM domain
MKNDFNWGDDIIDSRDIIAKYEELQDEYDGLVGYLEEAQEDLKEFIEIADEELTEKNKDFEEKCASFREAIQDAQEALDQFNQSFEKDELDTLQEVISQGENSPDWNHGEGLIHDSYFTDYTKDLIKDCWELPKEIEEGCWPWNHMEMDWEGAAEEAKSDYFDIEVDGNTYWIRG